MTPADAYFGRGKTILSDYRKDGNCDGTAGAVKREAGLSAHEL